MKQLRGAASVIISAIVQTPQPKAVPLNFGRAFTVGRNFLWNWEGGIGHIMGIEPVLNQITCTFSLGKATVFAALAKEMGIIPDVNAPVNFTPAHFQITDLKTRTTFCIVQFGAITAQQVGINRATTISDNFSGEAQWAYFRDELEGGQTFE